MMTKALTETFPSVRSVLPFSYLTMILARFLPSSELVWAVANTKVPFCSANRTVNREVTETIEL